MLPYLIFFESAEPGESFRSLLAGLTALGIVLAFGRPFIRYLGRRQVLDAQSKGDSVRLDDLHAHKASTPTLGGVLIVAGTFGATILWARLDRTSVILLLGYATALALLGFLDDTKKLRTRKKGMSARGKLRCQLAISAAIGAILYLHPIPVTFPSDPSADATSLFVPLLDHAPRLGVLFILLVVLVTTGSSNAVNLTDGLDGLATGVSILAALPLIALTLAPGGAEGLPLAAGGAEVAVFLSALVGACLGFLWFNGHPAQIFMGDTGSLPIGGSLGLAAVLLKLELVLLVAGGVLVAEALSVLLQVSSFKLTRKRIFLIAPLHHHFQFKGWPETKVTLRFWIAGAVLAWVSLMISRTG